MLSRKLLYSWIVALLLMLSPTMGAGAGPEEAATEECPPPSEEEYTGWRKRMSDPETWETWHDQMSLKMIRSTERVDRFFGDESLDEENKFTRIRLGAGVEYHKEDGASLLTDIKARLALPRMRNRLQLVIDDSFESDEPGQLGVLTDAARDSEPDTALRYIIREKAGRWLSADVGARFSSPSQLFTRLRGRATFPWEVWVLRLTQTIAWFTDDGLVTTSEMRWTRKMGTEWLARSNTSLTWEENEDGVTPAKSFSLFRELTSRRGYFFKISGSWPESPHCHEAVYRTEFTYRQLIYSDWLFIEITPGTEFPQESDYAVTPYIQLKFEVIFDEEKDFPESLP